MITNCDYYLYKGIIMKIGYIFGSLALGLVLLGCVNFAYAYSSDHNGNNHSGQHQTYHNEMRNTHSSHGNHTKMHGNHERAMHENHHTGKHTGKHVSNHANNHSNNHASNHGENHNGQYHSGHYSRHSR